MIVATCLGALAIVWLVVAVWIGQLREIEREAATREMSSLATLLVDHTERTFQGVDLLLALFTSRLSSVLAAETPPNPAELHEILHRDMAGLPQVRRAFAFGTDGKVIADSQFPEPRMIDASDRPHFTVHRDDPNTGIFVSEPIQSRVDGDWSIVLSRRLSRPDGSFAGVVGATLGPEYIAKIFAASIRSTDTNVVLWHNSHVVLATSSPDQPPFLGTKYPFPSGHAPERSGWLLGKSPFLGEERVAAYARLTRYPVMIVVTRMEAVIAQSSVRSERMIIGAGGLVSVLVVAIGMLLIRQIRSLEMRFREGIDRMSDGFALWDADDRLIIWNKRFEFLMPATVPFLHTGVHIADLIRNTMEVTRAHLPKEEREALLAERLSRIRARKPWEMRTHDGRLLEVEESPTATGGTVTVMRDMTQHKQNEAALERALVVEREANELHRRFVAMASHEFRTPLAVIDGAAQRLLSRAPVENPDSVGRLDRIRHAVSAMTMLIDRTLSSARLEAGSIAVETQTFDIGAMIHELCERQRQISPGFEIATSIPDGELLLDGDPRLLEQVFGNLLSNAVKYSGKSRRIEVDLASVGDGELRIAVRDRGIGIDADEVDKLFTRFFRARTAKGISGTGIGLHLARELVRLHDGRIEVRSRIGEGTSFIVTLPQRREMRAADAA